MRKVVGFATFLCVVTFAYWLDAQTARRPHRNVIVFIADGLRAGSVNATDTPTLWSVRRQGVHFANSHSLFPTFTMANASAIAAGHGLADTGVFSNVIWTGYATYSGTPVPFIENDRMLADIAGRFKGRFPTETTLLAAAAKQGFNTASIGKLGPSGLLSLDGPAPLVIDDSTGGEGGFPLPATVLAEMRRIGLPVDAPTRSNGYGPASPWNNGYAGTSTQPGTQSANAVQQQWFADVATRVVLPLFQRESAKPFVLMYWSRDPDGTQHNHGDSLGSLSPGINGSTSRMAVRNADRNLKQILDWLDSNPSVKANTNVFVTSDHGFATISKREIAPGVFTSSEAAKHNYVDATGNVETERGMLPYGFLAIDLALGLNTNLFDPDRRSAAGAGGPFRQIRLGPDVFERPAFGGGLIGQEVKQEDGSDSIAIVAANGGSDLIYVPSRSAETVQQITRLLTTLDYVGGIFVHDSYGALPGALPMSAIGLTGSSDVPHPAIVVAFKVFYQTPGDLQSAVQVSDASQQHGQGMHGGLGRESTFNNMAGMGPDFKLRYVDQTPVSNADIAPTLARILGVELPSIGTARGRVIVEALRGGPAGMNARVDRLESGVAGDRRTVVHFQQLGGIRYIDRACFVAASVCP